MPKPSSKPDKKSKKGNRVPNIPLTASLRPRLDGMWQNSALLQQDDTALMEQLDTVVRGVQPPLFLPVLIASFQAAPATVQERLNTLLPSWLQQRGYDEQVRHLMRTEGLSLEHQQQMLGWLEAIGDDTSDLRELVQQNTFYRAFCTDDRSQASVTIYSYADRQRSRAQGLNFLIDYNPPWNGAVKDIAVMPKEPAEEAVRKFLEYWSSGMAGAMQEIDASEAKDRIIEAMEANRTNNIRLHRDFIPVREHVLRHILTLPGAEETPPFTSEDFDYILRNGQPSEQIQRFEQTVGRRVRLPDGKEAAIANLSGEEEEW